jgi:hypothetical protein
MTRSGGVVCQRIKTSSRLALKKSFSQLLILDKEEIKVKFKENIIFRQYDE